VSTRAVPCSEIVPPGTEHLFKESPKTHSVEFMLPVLTGWPLHRECGLGPQHIWRWAWLASVSPEVFKPPHIAVLIQGPASTPVQHCNQKFHCMIRTRTHSRTRARMHLYTCTSTILINGKRSGCNILAHLRSNSCFVQSMPITLFYCWGLSCHKFSLSPSPAHIGSRRRWWKRFWSAKERWRID